MCAVFIFPTVIDQLDTASSANNYLRLWIPVFSCEVYEILCCFSYWNRSIHHHSLFFNKLKMDNFGWYVAMFPEEDEIEVLLSNWLLDDTECLWPQYSKGKLQTAIKSREVPDNSFASSKATKVKFTSDVSSANECLPVKRIKRIRGRYSSSSSSESYEENVSLPKFPATPSQLYSEKNYHLTTDSQVKSSSCLQTSQNTSSPSHEENICTTQYSQDRDKGDTSSIYVSTPTSNRKPEDYGLERSERGSNKEDLHSIAKHLEIIAARVKENSNLLHLILNKFDKIPNEPNMLDNPENETFLRNFPVDDIEKMQETEQMLMIDERRNLLINAMSRIGGDSVGEHVRRVMVKLIDDNVAKLYSWCGHQGKKSLSNLKLAEVLINSVRSKNKETTDKAIELIAAKWLTKASERLKRNEKDDNANK